MNKIITSLIVALNAVNAAVLEDAILPQVEQSQSPEDALAFKKARAEAQIKMIDTNRDGKIDVAEFFAYLSLSNKEHTDDQNMVNAEDFIRVFDQNGDNALDLFELANKD